jgi:hypothetical protein
VAGQMASFPAYVALRLYAWRRNLKSHDLALLLGLPVVYATVAVLIPPYCPLLQPDSTSYVEFNSIRTALYPLFLKVLLGSGLDLVQITYVQIVLFSLCLFFLLSALLRIDVPRPLIAIFVALLCANVYFSSFHRTILTESLFCSVMMLVIAFLLDFLRSGKSVFLALASLGMGLLSGNSTCRHRPGSYSFCGWMAEVATARYCHADLGGRRRSSLCIRRSMRVVGITSATRRVSSCWNPSIFTTWLITRLPERASLGSSWRKS